MKRVLIAPLNWGLGHATRCVPLIEAFLKRNVEIILAGEGLVFDFLRHRYPFLHIINLPGQRITYQVRGSLILALAKSFPGFLRNIELEHHIIKDLIEKYRLGAIISDNRYGLWDENIPSFMITHQINVRGKGLWRIGEPFAHAGIRRFLNHFHEIWIPDFPQFPGLAGDLSHDKSPRLKYRDVGPLSRFEHAAPIYEHPQNDIMAIISGPEPQRTIFENILTRTFEGTNLKTIILRGLPSHQESIVKINRITLYSHLQDDDFIEVLKNSRHLVCRSGYSSLMDLTQLERTALLVPTPGQPEQEYLARLSSHSGYFTTIPQNQFHLDNFPDMPSLPCFHTINREYLDKACEMVIGLL